MAPKTVIVSAPGKLHLAGEHVVVHGKPAVVVATSKRLYVTFSQAQADEAHNKTDLTHIRHQDTFIDTIVSTVEKHYQQKIAHVNCTINSDIPIGQGMGSSAALSVALIGAISVYFGKTWNPTLINELAYKAEKVKHVNASGSDPTIVVHGGILWYRKELDFLKTFWLLPFKLPKTMAQYVLIDTGRTETTGDLVVEVARYKKSHEQAFILLATQIEEITRQMVQAIHDEDQRLFCKCIKQNQYLLEKLPVVSSSTKKLIRAIETIGGYAKISGAGGVKKGSGIVIALHNNPKKLIALAKQQQYQLFLS